MTDRHAGYLITLAEDIREDAAEKIVSALYMIRGVIDVAPVTARYELRVGQARADDEWREKLGKLIRDSYAPAPRDQAR